MEFLAVVEDSFTIPGRGCAIVPDLVGSYVRTRVRSKDLIQLRRQDGQIFDTHILSVEHISPGALNRVAFMLAEPITKEDVPKGTEIWLVANPD